MNKFERFRKNFPAYSDGAYLNHAAVSPFSMFIKDELEKYWNTRSHFPVDLYPGIIDKKNEFRSLVSKLINASSNIEIAFTENTSAGLNIIANGLQWKAGDRIILNSIEFPANVYPFLKLENKGVIIDWVSPVDGEIRIKNIEKLIKPETKLIAISYVQFLNGYKADLEKIGQLCKKNAIIFVVDGIQGIGVFPLDVQKYNIDVLSAGGHKWLMWPMGTGFVYIKKELIDSVFPVNASWLSVEDSWNFFDYNLKFLKTTEKFEGATLNFLGLYCAIRMLKEFFNLNIHEIQNKILNLTDYLIQNLQDLEINIVSPLHERNRSGIISIKMNRAKSIFDDLHKNKITVSLRDGLIRISPHCTNNKSDIDILIEILKKYC